MATYGSGDTESETVFLPPTPESLYQIIKNLNVDHVSKIIPLSEQPEWFQTTLKYTLPSLSNGRSLNQVKIIAAGETSISKRDIVSAVFKNKLSHNNVTLSSDGVRYYYEELKLSDEQSVIQFELLVNVVDMCTGTKQDKCNHKAKKLKNHIENASNTFIPDRVVRIIPSKLSSIIKYCRPVEYPNLVLYFAENRALETHKKGISGHETAYFQLSQLHKMNLVDTTANNLVVIILNLPGENSQNNTITHAMDKQSSSKNKADEENANSNPRTVLQTEGMIQDQVVQLIRRVFNKEIKKVPLLILNSNQHTLASTFEVKESVSDEMGKSNLPVEQKQMILTSIKKIFSNNEDKLGLLLLSWLVETSEEKEILAKLMNASVSAVEKMVVDGGSSTSAVDSHNIYPGFHSIGQAFCPVSETLRMHNVFEPERVRVHKNVVLGETMFQVPDFVEVFQDVSTESWSLSHNNKEAYEANRKYDYGFEKGVVLHVDASSRGSWASSSASSSSTKSDAVLHEVRLAFLQVMNPDDFLGEEIKKELKKLSDASKDKQLSQKNRRFLYDAFFARWGTHFVCKQWLGGYIKTDTTDDKEASKSKNHAGGFFEFLVKLFGASKMQANVEVGHCSKAKLFSVRTGGQLSITGHEHDDLMYLEFDKITPELYYSWVAEVKKRPNALNYSFLLYPYYNLKSCKDNHELRHRTLDYLANPGSSNEGCFPATTLIRMNDGNSKPICDLEKFDSTMSVEMENACGRLSPALFFTYLHKEKWTKTVFLKLTFSNGKYLKATGNHLLFVVEGGVRGLLKAKRAQEIALGERVMYINENRNTATPTLVNIDTVEDYGIYCPLTSTGCLIADGFLVTCYASVDSFETAHAAMGPLRWWYACKSIIPTNKPKGKNTSADFEGIHGYGRLLMWFRCFFHNSMKMVSKLY